MREKFLKCGWLKPGVLQLNLNCTYNFCSTFLVVQTRERMVSTRSLGEILHYDILASKFEISFYLKFPKNPCFACTNGSRINLQTYPSKDPFMKPFYIFHSSTVIQKRCPFVQLQRFTPCHLWNFTKISLQFKSLQDNQRSPIVIIKIPIRVS